MKNNTLFDAIIIGGSYAGLSAAMSLGRSLRKVLIIDEEHPCNRSTPRSHNFLTQDGVSPGIIAGIAKEQVLQYETIRFLQDSVAELYRSDAGFELKTRSGSVFAAKKIVLACGIKDRLPEIAGMEACWGKSVIHCPYCHGYEFRGQPTALMGPPDKVMHMLGLIANLTKDISIITNAETEFSEEQAASISQKQVPVINTGMEALIHENGWLEAIAFKNGTKQRFNAFYFLPGFEHHSLDHSGLNLEYAETGHLKVDMFQKTNVYGVFACGDIASPMRSVASAVLSGNVAGAMINFELVSEEF